MSATRTNGALVAANRSQLRIDPVTVDGITYGNSAFTAVANVAAPTLNGADVAVGYFSARISTAFVAGNVATCGNNLDLANLNAVEGLGITLTLNGPTATPTTIQRTISGTAVNLTVPATGTYALATPANMTVGGVAYRFIPSGAAAAPYQSAVTAHTVSVCLAQ